MEAKWHSPVPVLSKELCLAHRPQRRRKVREEEKGNVRDVPACTHFFLQSNNSSGIVAEKEDSVFVTYLGYCQQKVYTWYIVQEKRPLNTL